MCRICMINSDVFEYGNLMEKTIFNNIRLCDAFKLITGLDVRQIALLNFRQLSSQRILKFVLLHRFPTMMTTRK